MRELANLGEKVIDLISGQRLKDEDRSKVDLAFHPLRDQSNKFHCCCSSVFK